MHCFEIHVQIDESGESGSLFTQYSCLVNGNPNSEVKMKSGRNYISLCWDSIALMLSQSGAMFVKPTNKKLLRLCNWHVEELEKKCKYLKHSSRECPDLLKLHSSVPLC